MSADLGRTDSTLVTAVSPVVPSVFISYSRADKDYVRRLSDALVSLGHKPWVDWEGIPPTADFLEEIYAAIRAADTFVFVLSPTSAKSRVCGLEVTHAVAHNKRLVPIVYRDVDPAALPPQVAALNWILARESEDFDTSVRTLTEAVATDLDWVRMHTRLTLRAVEWDGRRRDPSYSLRGTDLTAAERALAGAGETAQPRPTALHRDYVLASRQGTTRRQRIAFGSVSVALVVSVALAVLAFALYGRANTERLRAEKQTRNTSARGLAALSETVRVRNPQLAILLASEALGATMRAGEPYVPTAESALRRALESAGGVGYGGDLAPEQTLEVSPDGRHLLLFQGSRLVHLQDLDHPDAPPVVPGGPPVVKPLRWSPDGRRLATLTKDHAVRLWDLNEPGSGPVTLDANHGLIDQVCFNASGSQLGGFRADPPGRPLPEPDRSLWVWDTEKPDPKPSRLPLPAGTFEVHSFGLTGGFLALTRSPLDSIQVQIWDLDSLERPHLQFGLDFGDPLEFSADGRWLIAKPADASGKLVLWNLADSDPSPRELVHYGGIGSLLSVRFSGGSHRPYLAIAIDSRVRVWQTSDLDAKPFERVWATGNIGGLAIDRDGFRIAVAGDYREPNDDQTVRVWDIRKPDADAIELRGHEGLVESLTLRPGSRGLIVRSDRGARVRVWDIDQPAAMPQVVRHQDSARPVLGVRLVGVSPDGRWLLTHDPDDEVIRIRDARNPARVYAEMPLSSTGGSGTHAFSRDGRRLTLISNEIAKVWDLGGPEPVPLGPPMDNVAILTMTSDGRRVVTGSPVGELKIWTLDPPSVKGVILRKPQQRAIQSLQTIAVSPDGRWLVHATPGGGVVFWDLIERDPEPRVLQGAEVSSLRLAFSPDSRWLATGGSRVLVWELAQSPDRPRELWRLPTEHSFPLAVQGLTFNGDGRLLAASSGGDDGSIRVWDMLQPSAPLAEFRAGLRTFGGSYEDILAFDRDARHLYTLLRDGKVRCWDLAYPSEEPFVFRALAKDRIPTLVLTQSNMIYTPNQQGALRVWDVRLEHLLVLARRTAGRTLTEEEKARFQPDESWTRVTSPARLAPN